VSDPDLASEEVLHEAIFNGEQFAAVAKTMLYLCAQRL
jgi:hypothetical protein